MTRCSVEEAQIVCDARAGGAGGHADWPIEMRQRRYGRSISAGRSGQSRRAMVPMTFSVIDNHGPGGLCVNRGRQPTRQAKPSQAKPSQARPSQAKPGQARPSQAKPGQARPRQASPGPTRNFPVRAWAAQSIMFSRARHTWLCPCHRRCTALPGPSLHLVGASRV